MRVRIKQMREALQSKLDGRRPQAGLQLHHAPEGHVQLLRPGARGRCSACSSEFGVYGVDSGRICVAALNSKNIDAVVAAIAKVS